MKKFFLTTLALLAVAGSARADFEGDGFKVTRISNPMSGEREVDGLVAGGDRENSYTWRLAMRGDEIYIATARNISSALVNMYAPSFTAGGISTDAFWAMIDLVTNGDILRNDEPQGANIISYNRKTQEFKVVYTAEPTVYFRMAVTFGEDVYFGTYSADPTMPQYILKLDSDGNFTKVFQTMHSVSLRANCEYDGHLYFAGADEREVVTDGGDVAPSKMAVLCKSNDDDTQWDRVADYKDFGAIPYDPIMSSWAGCPIWELAVHKGYIYATAPSMRGFVIFRGHPAAEGETPNEYGWYWEEVAGLNNGINNPGLCDIVGGQPGTMRSLIGSVYEFDGSLYAYDFDHAFGGMAQAFAGVMQQIAGVDTKPSEYLSYMYNSLQNPQRIWRLNDATGKFEECKNFTQLVDGTTNEYIWRMGQYDNQLYIATMDAGIFYGYLTQLTNGSFCKMTKEEKISKINYLIQLIKILTAGQGDNLLDGLREKLEQLKSFLENFLSEVIANEDSLSELGDLQQLIDLIKSLLNDYMNLLGDNDIDALTSAKLQGMNYNGTSPAMAVALNLLPEGALDTMCDDAKAQLTGRDFKTVKSELNAKVRKAISIEVNDITMSLQDILDKIDFQGIKMYLEINKLVMDDEWGFDLYRTSDGETFETITRDGCGDKYNYGCPSFLATEEGLYFGTCNPFYGGQLYLLSNDKKNPEEEVAVADVNTDVKHSNVYYTTSGIRIKGMPTEPGIYINDGRKVVIK
ncbi:MAG: hypothetical protein IKR25_03000 [Muribaculaceae bacterium]|nr:hypothetical protein [Muribaculaceae bacterium]